MFRYDERAGTIIDAGDEGMIAELVETVDPLDGQKMAAGPDLHDALAAIMYAVEIGEVTLPAELSRWRSYTVTSPSRCGAAALARVDD